MPSKLLTGRIQTTLSPERRGGVVRFRAQDIVCSFGLNLPSISVCVPIASIVMMPSNIKLRPESVISLLYSQPSLAQSRCELAQAHHVRLTALPAVIGPLTLLPSIGITCAPASSPGSPRPENTVVAPLD